MSAARRARDLSPDDARTWSDLGRVHASFGELTDAMHCFESAVRIDRHHVDSWHNLGTALKKLGEHERAFDAFKTALQLDPTRADTYLNLGNLLIEAGQFEDAVECFERAAERDPKLAAARSRLAEELSQQGKVQRAETLFRQSVALDPDHAQGWFGLGRTLEDLGDAQNALACYRQVLARRPDHAQALGQYLALLRDEGARPGRAGADADGGNIRGARERHTDEIVAHATAVLHRPALRDEAKALIGYGLAKYHDRRSNFAEAASVARIANEARRRVAGAANRAALSERVDNLIATYDREFFFQRRQFGVGTDQPVFIVGLPRSGTTLCEQILSSHPKMHGAGELPDLANIATASVGEQLSPWQAAANLTEPSSRELALRYLRAMRNGAPKDRHHISDKSPLNFFQLAFVALLFPNARVIHCIREARDNALSIWMENFNSDQAYATDFGDLAFFRGQYERLMTHWRDSLPLRMLEVHYEDTVKDVESQARRLLSFLDVPWDERCLQFHRNDRAVQTPSRWQVRQPIYRGSVERWRNYAPHLDDLIAAFPR